jgi:deoxyribodipyrimidine photo-lyase
VAAPARLRSPVAWPCCTGLNALRLAELPRRRDDGTPIDWAAGIRQHWRFGEQGAAAALEEFVQCALDKFDAKGQGDKQDSTAAGAGKPPSERFRADRKNTARISPYMHFGELGPRQVYHRVLQKQAASGGKRDQRSVNTFLRRLAWRDLAYWCVVGGSPLVSG